ncbi:hypothetical protein HYPSUDRAFT_202507 [Hypholoma sublateritium FD-334 SS-4]|uniref:Uncharacterized protein n=1 Tax=Hypholoma sublateritium (strain FD-334 SS-4) TaxID=945553 RepID=A0A0D2NT13_HYPSF|nr:hypothetical protein HYPSUDRAFT_202507 [Hypholoma sublateritium FD-334 SS-4]
MSPVLRPPVRALSALQDPVAEIYPSLVYNPSMRGSQRRRTYSPTAVRSNPDTEEANADELRMDAFERAYAIKWISVLVATLDYRSAVRHVHGTSAVGVLTRTLVFLAAHAPVRVAFTDTPFDTPLDNADYASVAARCWRGSGGGGGGGALVCLLELGAGLVNLVLATSMPGGARPDRRAKRTPSPRSCDAPLCPPAPAPAPPPPTPNLIIPLRATHSAELRTVEQVFAPPAAGVSGDDEAAMVLVIDHMQTLACTTETPGMEITYGYYRTGWERPAKV